MQILHPRQRLSEVEILPNVRCKDGRGERMRLIDADALKESMGEHPYNWNDSPEEIQESFDWENFMQLIDDAPTIDVAPVRHGRWVIKKVLSLAFPSIELPFGSLCGGQGSTSNPNGYCPMCGAKMDEVSE